jgi:hypothetical protein
MTSCKSATLRSTMSEQRVFAIRQRCISIIRDCDKPDRRHHATPMRCMSKMQIARERTRTSASKRSGHGSLARNGRRSHWPLDCQIARTTTQICCSRNHRHGDKLPRTNAHQQQNIPACRSTSIRKLMALMTALPNAMCVQPRIQIHWSQLPSHAR